MKKDLTKDQLYYIGLRTWVDRHQWRWLVWVLASFLAAVLIEAFLDGSVWEWLLVVAASSFIVSCVYLYWGSARAGKEYAKNHTGSVEEEHED